MKPMQLCLAPAATLAALLVVTPASAQGGKSVERLYILNCGEGVAGDISRWSPGVNVGKSMDFADSCYLIKHGDDYLLWDTGHAMTTPNVAPKVSIIDQLEKIGVKVDQVKYVGISHYHGDHTGQVGSFPKATLLIGSREWDAITSPKPAEGVNFKPFENWAKGEGKVEALALDKDVFGDGSVIVLRTPGHTPGHQSLLVKLPQMGAVVIVGDAAHFRENYDSDGVPAFNFDRAQTVASLERLKKIAANLKATVIIQHDARDIDKLPAFPASAK